MTATQSRFEKFVTRQPNGCWTWSGAKTVQGYGRFHLDGNRHAHRVSYEIHKGQIPAGLVLDHLCRTPSCVNPEHLEIVTRAENNRRADHYGCGWSRNKTHCLRGHEFTPENTYVKRLAGKNPQRVCKTCHQLYKAKAKGELS